MLSLLIVVSLALQLSIFFTEPCPNGCPSSDFCPVAPALSRHLGVEFSWLTLRRELKQRCMTHVAEHRLFLIALIICGDVHSHPGPALGEGVFPCALCELKCTWDSGDVGGAVCCDDCSMWYHRLCLDMSHSEYRRLGNSATSWHCTRCDNASVNSFTSHGYNIPIHNSFSVLLDMGEDSVFLPNRSAVLSPTSDFNPGAFSSPRSTGLTSGSTGKSQGSTMGGSKDKSLSNPNGKLRILTVNANSVKGKAVEIASICDYVKPDIVAMSKTKLDKSVNAAEFLPVNFHDNVIRKDRNLHGGGVLLAHREGLGLNPVSCKGIKNDCELVFSRVSMANGQPPLYIGAYFRSQIDNTANTSLDGLSSALSQVTDLVSNSKGTVILMGDFNCPDICWDSLSTKTGGKVIGVSEKLINVSTQHGLQQLQRESTKLDSILDLFFTSNVSLMSSIDTIPGISTDTEHEAIVVDLNLKAELIKSAPHRVYLLNKVKWDSIKAATSEFVSRFCAEASDRSVEEQWESIENHLTKMLKEIVLSKFTRRRTDQLWLSGDLKRRCRKKQRLYNRWKKLKSRKKPCKGAREAYKRYHHDTNNLLKKSRNQYINNILIEGLENKSQKSFWRYIKTQRTESSGVAPLKEKGQIHSGPGKKANILANQFRSVFTVDGPEATDTHLAGPSYPPMPDVTITETGVNKLLKGIQPV